MSFPSSDPPESQDPHDPARVHRGDATFLERIQNADVRRFVDHWRGLRRGRAMPARKDIDPIDIIWALPRIFLGDYDRDEDAFIYRLAGEEIVEMLRRYNGGSNMRGVRLGDGMPDEASRILKARWRPLSKRGELIYMSGTVYLAAERLGLGERVVLPLSDDGVAVTGFVGFTTCEWMSKTQQREAPQLEIWYIPNDCLPAVE